MPSSNYPVTRRPEPGTDIIRAPVAFGHRTAPVAFAGQVLRPMPPDGNGFRFEGRVTRSTRFPVEAALAMNEPRSGRVGYHVDMHC